MLEGIKIARSMGFKTGIVTNAYYAVSEKDTELWLKPLCELGLSNLTVSDDSYHHEEENDSPAKRLLSAAKKLGISVNPICTDRPTVKTDQDKGTAVIEGGTMFRGRAVEKLTEGLPKRHWKEFTECPHENLREPGRIHLDCYGNVHICQGLSMGNMWKTPLSVLVKNYKADSHPVCGPIAKGGPALLAKKYNVQHEDKYVDACHLCYFLRLALLDRFPEYLAPRQVYGL